MKTTTERALALLTEHAERKTWNELAEETGIHASTLARWVNKKSSPRLLGALNGWYRKNETPPPSAPAPAHAPSPPLHEPKPSLDETIRQIVREELQKDLPGAMVSALHAEGFRGTLDEAVKKALRGMLL